MKFYLRKKMRLGPIRFVVTSSPRGIRAAVEKEDENPSPAVLEYTMGTRRGLYYRKKYKGKRLNARQAQEGLRGLLIGSFFLALAFMAASTVLWPHPIVPVTGFLLLGTVGGTLMVMDAKHCREMFGVKKELDAALIDPAAPPTEAEAARLYERSREMSFPVTLREDMYLAVLDRVLDDRKITEEEAALLATARYILSLSDHRVKDLHKELISSAWLQLLEKGELQPGDITWVETLSRDLGISQKDMDAELNMVRELSELSAMTGKPEPLSDLESLPALQENEVPYAAVAVTRLTPKVQLEGSSWQAEKEGTLLLTSERIFFKEVEVTEFPLRTVDRIEVDVDRSHLMIHRKGEVTSVHFQSKHPCSTGHLISQIASAA